jgi:AcrR family transcriptional regulator
MRREKHDRRSLRTRRLVTSALMELLLEKRYDAITVQDLLDRADVGRSTFYAHYFDKDDVLADITEQMLDAFRLRVAQQTQHDTVQAALAVQAAEVGSGHVGAGGQLGPLGQVLVPSLELFRHVHQQYPQLRALVRGHAGAVLWETGQALLRRNIERTLTSAITDVPTAPLPVPAEVVAQYLAGAFLNLLKWWLEAEMPYTPEQMDSLFQQLAMPGVWAIVGGKAP